MNGDGFTSSDLANAIMMGNQVALQWYAVTHQTAIPGTPGSVVISPTSGGGYSASFGSGSLLIVGLLVVGAIILLK